MMPPLAASAAVSSFMASQVHVAAPVPGAGDRQIIVELEPAHSAGRPQRPRDRRSVTHGRPLARLCGADSPAPGTRAARALQGVRRPRARCDLHAREFNTRTWRSLTSSARLECGESPAPRDRGGLSVTRSAEYTGTCHAGA